MTVLERERGAGGWKGERGWWAGEMCVKGEREGGRWGYLVVEPQGQKVR